MEMPLNKDMVKECEKTKPMFTEKEIEVFAEWAFTQQQMIVQKELDRRYPLSGHDLAMLDSATNNELLSNLGL
jgi:hypothetical protein